MSGSGQMIYLKSPVILSVHSLQKHSANQIIQQASYLRKLIKLYKLPRHLFQRHCEIEEHSYQHSLTSCHQEQESRPLS